MVKDLDIVGLVQKDMDERRKIGIQTYGHVIDVHDGRDWLVEAYEEALDMCFYLRAAIEKRKAPTAVLSAGGQRADCLPCVGLGWDSETGDPCGYCVGEGCTRR